MTTEKRSVIAWNFYVNGELQPHVQDISYTSGLGESKQTAQVVGGGKTELVYSKDLTTTISNITSHTLNTLEDEEVARSWQRNENRNTIVLEDPDTGKTRRFENCCVSNDPRFEEGVNKAIEVLWEGSIVIEA